MPPTPAMVIVLFNKHGLSACHDQTPRWAYIDSLYLGIDAWVYRKSVSLPAVHKHATYPRKPSCAKILLTKKQKKKTSDFGTIRLRVVSQLLFFLVFTCANSEQATETL